MQPGQRWRGYLDNSGMPVHSCQRQSSFAIFVHGIDRLDMRIHLVVVLVQECQSLPEAQQVAIRRCTSEFDAQLREVLIRHLNIVRSRHHRHVNRRLRHLVRDWAAVHYPKYATHPVTTLLLNWQPRHAHQVPYHA